MVECTALEMRHTGNRIGGSNPSLSATDCTQHLGSKGLSFTRPLSVPKTIPRVISFDFRVRAAGARMGALA